jgi:hypothetical protein
MSFRNGSLKVNIPSQILCLEANTVQIEPVLTGHRWVLTYNLIQDSENIFPTTSALESQVTEVEKVLSEWHGYYPYIAYPLNHQYTTRTPGLAHLKGLDYQRVRAVAEACSRNGGCQLWLAHLELRKTIPNDEHTEWDVESGSHLLNVCNTDGVELALTISVTLVEACLFGQIMCTDREPDSRYGGEYMGNSHCDLEEIYSDRVCMHQNIPHCISRPETHNLGLFDRSCLLFATTMPLGS